MKPLPMILVVLLAVGAGAAGGWLTSRCALSAAPVAAAEEALQADIKPQAGLPAKPTAREAELVAKVENLERALDAMHQDVMELRSGSSRTPALVVEPEKAPIDQDSVAFAAQHKTAIKAVIEEDRAEQAAKAEEERRQREIQQTLQRADRTAQRVGLNPAQTKQLESFYEQQRVRMEDLRGTMQNFAGGDPQAMRQTFQEFRAWSETELTTLFGSELSGKIMEEGGGFAMGRGGFGGGPGERVQLDGGPGGGGGQGARAARPAQNSDATNTGGRRRRNAETGAQPASGGAANGGQTPDGQTGGGGGY